MTLSGLNQQDISALINLALEEDIGPGDVTTSAIFQGNETAKAVIIAKNKGVFCHGGMAGFVYRKIDPSLEIEALKQDGDPILNGDHVMVIRGNTSSILNGERTVLNFLQRMTGIATSTNRIIRLLEGTKIKLLDTRKTIPGFRLIDKYAVRCGGGTNHRMGLFDMVMIKDNHITAAGSIREAVRRIREAYSKKFVIELEVADIDQVPEAISAGVDIIMLDNMDAHTIRKAVDMIQGKAKVEVSGNMDEKKIQDLRGISIDYISMGVLTHSVKAFDLSMKFE